VIGVGLVGAGYWGPNLLRNFADAAECRVVAVADRSRAQLEPLGRRYPTVELLTDAKEVIEHPDVDAVVVATPVSTHYEIARSALEAGKHVLVEKPLAANADQGRRLLEEAERRGRVLMVDHTFIYTGAVRCIHDLVRRGELGELYYYDSVRINLGMFQSDVNVIWDLAAHDLAVLDHVVPARPVAVSATGSSHVAGNPEDIAYLTLHFDDSLIAHLHVNWLAPVKVRRTLIGGSRKMIVYDDLEPSEKVRVYDRGISARGSLRDLQIHYRAGDVWSPRLDVTEALAVVVAHFLACIAGRERPLSDGAAGLRVVRLLEAASRSLAERGRPVELGPG
jgi:predicted dehydrogenase